MINELSTPGIYRYVKLDLRLYSVVVGQVCQWKNIDSFEVEPLKDITLACGVSLIAASRDDDVSQRYPVEEYPYRFFWLQVKNDAIL